MIQRGSDVFGEWAANVQVATEFSIGKLVNARAVIFWPFRSPITVRLFSRNLLNGWNELVKVSRTEKLVVMSKLPADLDLMFFPVKVIRARLAEGHFNLISTVDIRRPAYGLSWNLFKILSFKDSGTRILPSVVPNRPLSSSMISSSSSILSSSERYPSSPSRGLSLISIFSFNVFISFSISFNNSSLILIASSYLVRAPIQYLSFSCSSANSTIVNAFYNWCNFRLFFCRSIGFRNSSFSQLCNWLRYRNLAGIKPI